MKHKITIVDDDKSIHEILQLVLTAEDYELDFHTDVTQLIPFKEPFPKVFLLDRQLGGSNGLDICRMLKADPRTSLIPVIMFSASPDIANHAQEAGADAWLEKPFTIPALKDLIRYHIKTE